ncbi:hypothetical protein PM1_005 [Pectobacterium phage PM1]|uniref:Uncharacterized protein n=1 Tax=Pectobacterium phage PM1 TaxID=1399915 RepID=X2CSU9_9CAUD|nr:hypothetical protein PM1_005 [Pectobacterium phage PM1]AGV99221.1 hypothetical protein PM1_005 [Pectobacterium phage PM1]
MKRCPISGRILPNRIKVGDKAVYMSPTAYDLTYMREYTVVATHMSKDQSRIGADHYIKPLKDGEFIIVDDVGDRRFAALDARSLGQWEKLPK